MLSTQKKVCWGLFRCRDHSGSALERPLASFSMSGPTVRMTRDRIATIARTICSTAIEIEKHLGSRSRAAKRPRKNPCPALGLPVAGTDRGKKVIGEIAAAVRARPLTTFRTQPLSSASHSGGTGPASPPRWFAESRC